jgi:hypothetical protein
VYGNLGVGAEASSTPSYKWASISSVVVGRDVLALTSPIPNHDESHAFMRGLKSALMDKPATFHSAVNV